jgi:hypothetical protein
MEKKQGFRYQTQIKNMRLNVLEREALRKRITILIQQITERNCTKHNL